MRRLPRLIVTSLLALVGIAASPAPRAIATNTHPDVFAVCPDGRTLVAREGTSGWLIDWPSGEARRPNGDASKPPCAAASLGVSPDGKWWALGAGGDVIVRDLASGAEARRIKAHLDGVTQTVFSPDGRYLASAGEDNDVHIWDAKSWAAVKTIDSMTFTPFALAWSPDSSILYVGGSSRNVMAWSAATWTLLRSSSPQQFVIGSLAVSRDGRTIAAAGWDSDASGRPAAVLVLDAASLAQKLVIPTAAPSSPVAFSPDGTSLIGLLRGQAGLTVWRME